MRNAERGENHRDDAEDHDAPAAIEKTERDARLLGQHARGQNRKVGSSACTVERRRASSTASGSRERTCSVMAGR